MNEQLLFKKLDDQAMLPTRGSSQAAAVDLYAAEQSIVPARGFSTIKTGIAVAVPLGYYGRIAPRSGLAAKHGIDTLAGVVDSDYRGEVGVVLANHGDQDFPVAVGDRIAQFIIEAIITPEPVWVDELPTTNRGSDGFGSTGR